MYSNLDAHARTHTITNSLTLISLRFLLGAGHWIQQHYMRGLHEIGAGRGLVETEHYDFDLGVVFFEVLQRFDLFEHIADK